MCCFWHWGRPYSPDNLVGKALGPGHLNDGEQQTQVDEIDRDEIQRSQAEAWGLTDQEWSRYQKLKDRPRGTWSPDLDPITMLGIEARSEAERRHYAELLSNNSASVSSVNWPFRRPMTLPGSGCIPMRAASISLPWAVRHRRSHS
ncbi:hypothetical protein A8U91_03956 [Halomonas elongata]|uniref:Uncharacterized protein n=1 Tax=Halomonas elongata TaxID=2746 RepID=A0A1B8NY46_HALEL|nr:hypothetical protein A8U91_03956 [Halomonas elongata]